MADSVKSISPRPWRIEIDKLEGGKGVIPPPGFTIVDADGGTVCDFYVHTGHVFAPHDNDRANAEFVVRLANEAPPKA